MENSIVVKMRDAVHHLFEIHSGDSYGERTGSYKIKNLSTESWLQHSVSARALNSICFSEGSIWLRFYQLNEIDMREPLQVDNLRRQIVGIVENFNGEELSTRVGAEVNECLRAFT